MCRPVHCLRCAFQLCFFACALALAVPARAGPNDLVLIITNEDYREGIPKVEFARRDGEAFRKAMRELLGIPAPRILQVGGAGGATRGDFGDWFAEEGSKLKQHASMIRSDTNIYLL